MLTNRVTLENELNVVIDKYNMNKKVLSEVEDTLINSHNVLIGDITNIYNKSIPLETININLLYAICKGLYRATKEEKINPEKYFTKIEIEEGNKWRYEIQNNTKFPLVFKNTEKLRDDQFMTKITAQQLADLYNNNIIIYNKETQRNVRMKKVNDTIIELPNINWNSVNEIKKEILDGTFISNHITINILQNGEENFEFKSNVLTIYNAEINVLDGYHRSLAIINALMENPNLEFVTGLDIMNFDKSKAIKFIIQEDKRNKISTQYIKSLNVEKLENNVVKKINERMDSELKGKITTDKMAIKYNKALTTHDILAEAIAYNFKINTMKEVNDVSEFLIDGFNEIIGLYPEEFKEKDKSFINYKNMFIGYVGLLSKLYKTEEWKSKLENILKNVDFDINNDQWEKLGLVNDKTSKAMIKNISEYFRNLI